MGFMDKVVNYEQTIRNYGTAVTVGIFMGSAITTGCLFGVATYWFASKNLIGLVAGQIKTQAKQLRPLLLPLSGQSADSPEEETRNEKTTTPQTPSSNVSQPATTQHSGGEKTELEVLRSKVDRLEKRVVLLERKGRR